MLGIRRLFSSLFGTARNTMAGSNLNNHQIKVFGNLQQSGSFIEKLTEVSEANRKEQKEKREILLDDFLMEFNEAELIDIFSYISISKVHSKEVRDQATLFINKILAGKENLELHDYVSTEENNPIARSLAVDELIDRKDKSAALTFIYRVIVDSDDPGVREVAAMGLGYIGGKVALEVLEKVEEDDPIYLQAQKSIREILKKSEVTNVKACNWGIK
ncbi:MAG: hypothetical protein HY094_00130 [Candidatus Melainabacteria bacterium]|nr:hypothetical protein [Candidatus Melainabacteria bacterium]